MTGLTIKDAIDLFQEQMKIANDLWTFFGTVTLAVLGFTVGSEKATRSAREITLIVGGYVLFALGGNLPALRTAYAQLAQFRDLIKDRIAVQGKDLPPLQFKAYTVDEVTLFHVAVVVAVSIAMIIYWRTRGVPLPVSDKGRT